MPRILISSGSPYEASVGCSRAVVVANRIVTSGTAPIWPGGTCDPDVTVQARRCLEIILAALAEGGASAADVIRTRMYLVDAADAEAVSRVHGEVFGSIRPATTMGRRGGSSRSSVAA